MDKDRKKELKEKYLSDYHVAHCTEEKIDLLTSLRSKLYPFDILYRLNKELPDLHANVCYLLRIGYFFPLSGKPIQVFTAEYVDRFQIEHVREVYKHITDFLERNKPAT